MGYACPVCSDPQADATHLANHLAFTALARGGDHEDWLDETVPGWESLDEDGLAERLTDHADEREYPQVFEDTTDQTGEHTHDHQHGQGHGGNVPDAMLSEARDQLADAEMPDTDDVLAQAREMTRRRQTDDGEADGEEPGDTEYDSETE